MRVLIAYPRLTFHGGGELVVTHLCAYLHEHRIPHTLLTLAISDELRRHLPHTPVTVVEAPSGAGPFRTFLRLWRSLHRQARQHDLVNVQNFPTELAALFCRRPVVWLCNEPELSLIGDEMHTLGRKLLWRLAMLAEKHVARRWIDTAVVADEYNARRFQRLFGRETVVIPYGIDWEFFAAPADRPTRGSSADPFTILHVGMLTPLKNQLASLETVVALRATIPNLRLVLAGLEDQLYRQRLDEYIAQHDLKDLVLFTGHIDRHQLREYYRTCHVLLHPIQPQGGWLAPFEAMAAGCPVVVSPDLTAADIIRRHDLGIVTREYAAAIAAICRDPATAADRVERARNWVRANLSWDRFCQRLVAVFEQTAHENPLRNPERDEG